MTTPECRVWSIRNGPLVHWSIGPLPPLTTFRLQLLAASAAWLVLVCTQSQVFHLQCFLNVRPNVCPTGPVNIAQCSSPIFQLAPSETFPPLLSQGPKTGVRQADIQVEEGKNNPSFCFCPESLWVRQLPDFLSTRRGHT